MIYVLNKDVKTLPETADSIFWPSDTSMVAPMSASASSAFWVAVAIVLSVACSSRWLTSRGYEAWG